MIKEQINITNKNQELIMLVIKFKRCNSQHLYKWGWGTICYVYSKIYLVQKYSNTLEENFSKKELIKG